MHDVQIAARLLDHLCGFRSKAAGYSDLMAATVPT
jgi:hypothetical protein